MERRLSLSDLFDEYKKFEYGNHYVKGERPPRLLTSPFWNFSRSVFYELNKHCQGVNRRTTGFLWTNISKFDEGATTPNQNLQAKNERGFYLLKEEIRITKPDLVVFLTGSKYDYWIDKVFAPAKEDMLGDGTLWKLTATDDSLPVAFKTEHPRTMCARKTYRTVLNELLKTVQELNSSKVPVVRIDPSLEQYREKMLFPEKLAKANQMLETATLPDKKK